MQDYFMPETPITEAMVATNADRIRAMSDEELAKALLEVSDAGIYIGFCQEKEECIHELDEGGVPEERCLECMMQWLKKPVADINVGNKETGYGE